MIMITVETAERLRSILALIIMYFPSISLVGFGQAWIADRLGDHTSRQCGFLTLNPFKHFDFMGFLFLIVFGFGWHKALPINQKSLKKPFKLIKLFLIFFSPVFLHFLFGSFLLFIIVLMGGGIMFTSPMNISMPTSNLFTTIKFVLTSGAMLNIILTGWYTAIGIVRMGVVLFAKDSDEYSRTSDVIFLVFSILFAWIILSYIQHFIVILMIIMEWFFVNLLHIK